MSKFFQLLNQNFFLILGLFGVLLIALNRFFDFFNYGEFRENSHFVRYSKRQMPTPEAQRLSEELRKRGFYTEKEKWDGHKHIDIAITKAKINLEIDGAYHNKKADQALRDLKRTYYSLEQGYVTVRIPNSLVRYQLEETVDIVAKILNHRIKQLTIGSTRESK